MYIVRATGCVYSEACSHGAASTWPEYLWTNWKAICPLIKPTILIFDRNICGQIFDSPSNVGWCWEMQNTHSKQIYNFAGPVDSFDGRRIVLLNLTLFIHPWFYCCLWVGWPINLSRNRAAWGAEPRDRRSLIAMDPPWQSRAQTYAVCRKIRFVAIYAFLGARPRL